jgi:hypothetical protein
METRSSALQPVDGLFPADGYHKTSEVRLEVFVVTLSSKKSPTLITVLLDLQQRIRAEYLQMPGLKLTAPQARRLWGPDCATCDAALATLVRAKFLARTREGLLVLTATRGANQKIQAGAHQVPVGHSGPLDHHAGASSEEAPYRLNGHPDRTPPGSTEYLDDSATEDNQ